MHLKKNARVQIAVVQGAVHARHRDLHDVGRGALDRHVDRHAFRGVAHGIHAARHVGDVAPPSEKGLNVTLLDTERLRFEDIPPHLAVAFEVFVDEALRLLARHLHPPGEAEVAHAVDDPEVEHLGDVALLARDRTFGDTESRGGRASMDVGT